MLGPAAHARPALVVVYLPALAVVYQMALIPGVRSPIRTTERPEVSQRLKTLAHDPKKVV